MHTIRLSLTQKNIYQNIHSWMDVWQTSCFLEPHWQPWFEYMKALKWKIKKTKLYTEKVRTSSCYLQCEVCSFCCTSVMKQNCNSNLLLDRQIHSSAPNTHHWSLSQCCCQAVQEALTKRYMFDCGTEHKMFPLFRKININILFIGQLFILKSYKEKIIE